MYTIDASADEPIMFIDRHLGYNDEDGYGIDGSAFARELMAHDAAGKKTIWVWINSVGGSVMEAYAIATAMLQSKAKVNTKCVGMAASAAAVLFQQGRERVMCDYGILMYHNPFGSDDNDVINSFKKSLYAMICTRSGMSEADCAAMMNKETFMNANEALAAKMCDRIEGSADYNRKRMTAVTVENNAFGYYKAAQGILNQIFKPEIDMELKFDKIANKLGLVSAANEESIMQAITAIENRASAAEKRVGELTATVNTLTTEKTTLEGQIATARTEKENAEKQAKAVKAQALIAGAVKIGVIKNDAETIATWTENATNNYEATEKLLGSIPVNAQAKKIVNAGATGADAASGDNLLENAAAIEMAKIKNRMAGVK